MKTFLVAYFKHNKKHDSSSFHTENFVTQKVRTKTGKIIDVGAPEYWARYFVDNGYVVNWFGSSQFIAENNEYIFVYRFIEKK